MAKRTVEAGYFGSLGLGDPMSSFAERTFRVSWDFSKKNVPENKVIPLMAIPKGLCIDRISVVQTKAADQSVGLTFGLASDDAFTVGGTFTLAASGTLLRSSQAAKAAVVTKTASDVYVSTASASFTASDAMKLVTGVTSDTALFVSEDDVLCMVVPDNLTGDKCAAGAFDVCVHGFETFAEAPSVNAVGQGDYRKTLQTVDNVSGGQFPLD